MEDGLVRFEPSSGEYGGSRVLILIVVEDGLVHLRQVSMGAAAIRLNPYCSGRWSRTIIKDVDTTKSYQVLILIVVEDGLVRANGGENLVLSNVLILIVVVDGLVQ